MSLLSFSFQGISRSQRKESVLNFTGHRGHTYKGQDRANNFQIFQTELYFRVLYLINNCTIDHANRSKLVTL